MICYFANRAFTILGMASTSLKEGLRVYDDEKVEELESGYTSFEFTVGYEDRQEIYQVCAAGNYVIRDDEEDGQDIFTIITAEDDAEKKEITLYCEDLGLDLLNEVSDEFENKTAYGIKYYLEKFMDDSGFEVRRNEIPDDTLALSFDSTETVVKRVLSVAESFGVELAYHFEISNRKITHKYVDVYKKRGQDTKQEFRLGRDLSNIKRKESIEDMVSAVLARGGTPHAYHKYADTSTGGGMYDDSSQPHPYYGYITKAAANSKGYSEAPSDPSAYTWITIEQFNKIRKTIDDKYHKYADTATGGGMTDDSSWEKSYYGYTTTSTEDEAPTDPSAYTWITVEEYNETRDSDKYEAKQVTLNGVTYDDGDLYVDGGILGSRKSLYKWSRYLSENASGNVGHILGIKTFDDALTPTALLNEAKEYLEGCDEPKYTYEVEFVDFPHDLHLGDTIRIVDDEGGQYLSSRVIKISKKVSEQKWSATLGDYEILDAGISVKMEQMAESFAKALAQAQQEAESAKEAAKAASYTAGNSTDQAYVANNAAESASTTAAAAKTTAETANKTASTASTTAAEAKTTAETASTTASEAKTTATAASTTAAAAKTTAETALSTATKTNNYFFYDSAGAHVATTEGKADEGSNVLIDSDSLDIRNGTTVLSTFGASGATIGASGDQRVELTAGSMKVLDRGANAVFEIVDERDATTGLATVKETFQCVGQDTEIFYVSLPSQNSKIVSVLLGSTETTDYTEYSSTLDGHYLYGVQILDSVIQAANASTVTITYTTDAADWHLTIGSRDGDAGPLSTVIGALSSATSIGAYAEGYQSKASGEWSHAEGYGTTASDFYSHAEGYGTTASYLGAHAEGNSTTASGEASHAEGQGTTASGRYSHAGGIGTTAPLTAETVIGQYNSDVDNGAFVIGNGTSTARSNAFSVDTSGNTKINGWLEVAGDLRMQGSLGISGGFWAGSIELGSSVPYIDFHFANDRTVDYTTRIAEYSKGVLTVANSSASMTIAPNQIKFSDGHYAAKSDNRIYFYWDGSHIKATIDGKTTIELAKN